MLYKKGDPVFLWEVRFDEQTAPFLRLVDEGDTEYYVREVIDEHRATIFHLQDTINPSRPHEVIRDGYAEARIARDTVVFSRYPFYHWFMETEKGWRQFVGAIAGYNEMNASISGYYPFADSEGRVKIPSFEGISICTWHDRAYHVTSQHGCSLCFKEMSPPGGGHEERYKQQLREAFRKMTPRRIPTRE